MIRERRPLRCVWCRGEHITDHCPNRGRKAVKLTGTVDGDGRYVPPPGVRVRVMQVAPSMDSVRLRHILKELDGA